MSESLFMVYAYLFRSTRCWYAVLTVQPLECASSALSRLYVSACFVPFGWMHIHELHGMAAVCSSGKSFGAFIVLLFVWLVGFAVSLCLVIAFIFTAILCKAFRDCRKLVVIACPAFVAKATEVCRLANPLSAKAICFFVCFYE